eukprot:c6485_g1_i1.p1 GENE.c6485_g1_i1~~c6485_g1_i1.p1  ORF type:complete len:236 (+),score=51.46 c6485_g1_i1:390-1097(+)
MPLEVFIVNHATTHMPCILKDSSAHWPAVTNEHRRWCNLQQLRNRFGERTVPVEVGRHYMSERWGQKLMRFKDVLDAMVAQSEPAGAATEQRVYLAQHPLMEQFSELACDACVPDFAAALSETTLITNAWIGPAHTVSCLHYDRYHNILCQVVGRKHVRLYDPIHSASLYPHTNIMSNTSQVDPANVDTEAFPAFENVPFIECILGPGDALYIPPKWWHYVVALDLSFSVSFWFQ